MTGRVGIAVSITLNAKVAWERVLSQLGVAIGGPAVLPARVTCPLCHSGQGLKLQADLTLGGAWASCKQCGFQGDMIELAAKTWQLSIQDTVGKLYRDQLLDDAAYSTTDLYLRKHLEKYRWGVRALVERAQRGQFQSTSSARALLPKLGMPTIDLSLERYAAGPGRLFGVLHSKDVDHFFVPYSDKAKQQRSSRVKGDGFFPGRGWTDVVVVPFYDLPGRASAIVCIGREGRFPEDHSFCRTLVNNVGKMKRVNGRSMYEGGLAYHPDILNEAPEPLVVVDNAAVLLQMQLRHFEESLRPLHLAAWWDGVGPGKRRYGRTEHAWKQFDDRQKILWLPAIDARGIRQAITAGADISAFGGPGRSTDVLDKLRKRMSPADIVHQIRNTARPWHKVVSQAILQLADVQLEAIVAELSTSTDALLEHCSPAARERIRKLMTRSTADRVVHFENRKIVDSDEGWHSVSIRGNKALISDGRLRIEQAICLPESRRMLYRGRILFHGESIPFCVPQDEIEKAPFHWMQQTLIEAGKGLMRCNRNWGRHAVLLATQLYPPESVLGVGKVGWDKPSKSYRFPAFGIHDDGTADLSLRAHVEQHPTAQWLPASSLKIPTDVDPLYWSVLLCLLHNMLAPVGGRPLRSIGVVGALSTQTALDIAVAAGCELKLLPHSHVKMADAIESLHQHNWPVAIRDSDNMRTARNGMQQWLQDGTQQPTNTLLCLDGYFAAWATLNPGWHLVTAAGAASVNSAALDATPALVAAYLQESVTEASQATQSEFWQLSQLAKRLASWVQQRGGDPESVLEGAKRVTVSGRPEGFVQMLQTAVRAGLLRIITVDDPRYTWRGLYRNLEERTVSVPYGAINRCHSLANLPPANIDKITTTLERAGALAEPASDTGWVLHDRWWSRQARAAAKGLRLVG